MNPPPKEGMNSEPSAVVRGGRGFLFAKRAAPTTEPNEIPEVARTTGFGRAKLLQRELAQGANGVVVCQTVPLKKNGLDVPSIESLSLEKDAPEEAQNGYKPPIKMTGSSGTTINVVTNYIRLQLEEGKGIFQYAVKYSPEIDAQYIRVSLMKELVDIVGNKKRPFDGAILYLPFLLKEKVTVANCKLHDGTPVTVTITFVKKLTMGEPLAVHFYNVLFRRIMNILGLALSGRKFFDPKSAHMIPEYKLEVWPGYVTAIQDYEDGVMLCCDSSHRILRNQTVHELMMDLESLAEGDHQRWKTEFLNLLVGQTVLTRYNNKSYRIEDVDFGSSPINTFTMKNDQEISYVEYYRRNYNINIKDPGQPLLKCFIKAKVRGEETTRIADLIPELCYLSGITDPMRNDFKLMKSIIQHTRISPAQRQCALKQFLNNINCNQEVHNLLGEWGLSISNKSISLSARLLDPVNIYFGKNYCETGTYAAEWNKAVSYPMCTPIDLTTWAVICPKKTDSVVKDFLTMCENVCGKMDIRIHRPRIISLQNDNTSHYVQELRKMKSQNQVQLVLIVLALSRNDMYQAVKKVACLENPVPSQVVISRTLRNPKSLRSVTQKIILQMNCKLGGTLWRVPIPVKKTMVLGFDTYHDPTRTSSSVGAVVASLNESLTSWYNTIYRQEVGEELIDGLEMAFTRCLVKTNQVNGFFPEQIIVYRDGVGDGALKACKEFEVFQLERACKKISPQYSPRILFVVVQKNITTRYFAEERGSLVNPPPGTVVDHTITRRDLYDFFLVSQNVRQGTVSPTHYIVIHNTTRMDPDKVQRFTYTMTHLYYNWCGTIRVPAPCQYAHRLAKLVGVHLHKEADESLNDKLFFL